MFRLIENAYKNSPKTSFFSILDEYKDSEFSESEIKSYVTADGLSTQDIGPFYGLPSKVKLLLEKVRGIKDLYGKIYNASFI